MRSLARMFLGTIAAAASGMSVSQVRTVADLPAWAQVRQQTPRKALVIGVGQYDTLPKLTNPERDAVVMSDKLSQLGFSVIRPTGGLDRASLLAAIGQFSAGLGEGDIAVVYFSGHGVERGGANYLIPADVRQMDPGREGLIAINTEFVLAELEKRKASLAIVILDACREDPFTAAGPAAATLTEPKGLAPIVVNASGLFIGFAAAPRTPSYGGLGNDPPNSASIFTRYLADALPQEGRSLFWIWKHVGDQVYRVTLQRQRPWQNSSLFPEVKLKPAAADLQEAEKAWVDVLSSGSPLTLESDLEAYLGVFPDSPFAPTARVKLREIRASPPPVPAAPSPDPAGEQMARLAMQTRQLSGAVTSSSFVSSLTDINRVAAANDLVLRERPDADAPAVTMVAAGTGLSALSMPDASGWLPVRLEDGATGYVGSVTASTMTRRAAESVAFGRGESAARPVSISHLSPLVESARRTGAQVTVDLGASSEELPDRAVTTSYLRSVALRSALVSQGLRPDRIQVRLLKREFGGRDDAAVALSE